MNIFTLQTKKTSFKVNCPASWKELTLKQWEDFLYWGRLGSAKDPLRLFAYWTGVDYLLLKESKEKKLLGYILGSISFMADPCPYEKEQLFDKQQKINDKQLSIPTNLDECSIGAKMYAIQEIEKDKERTPASYVLACYLQQQYFNEPIDQVKRIPELKEIIEKEPAYKWWPVASFFLTKSQGSLALGLIGWKLRKWLGIWPVNTRWTPPTIQGLNPSMT